VKINPQIIDNIAASVFWKHAFENGIQETFDSITEKIPSSIWSLGRAEEEINQYLNSELILKARKP